MWIFLPQNYIEKSTWKQRGFFDYQNFIDKSSWKQLSKLNQKKVVKTMWIFLPQNYI